ncbi:hypothetical protein [Deinococcus soli (ex Cha et al. 2016)]|uniref:hypothetical protein n=1 Tax=Deinococcus soli (ex Cha et al. 2016) TaxID=1309411 RepID=UPI001667A46A|nr:hypothetical protein [Deinococcus soli (ex Cha et al. 2016)]
MKWLLLALLLVASWDAARQRRLVRLGLSLEHQERRRRLAAERHLQACVTLRPVLVGA